MSRWIRRCCLVVLLTKLAGGGAMPVAAPDALTPALRDWVAQHPRVRYAVEPDYGPFVYLGRDGLPHGLSVDLLALIAAKTGLRLEPAPAAALDDNLRAAQRHRIDLLTSLRPTPERAAFLGFTAAYISAQAVLMRRADAAPSPLGAMDGLRVAVGSGRSIAPVMRAHYPRVRWVVVPSDADGLRQLVAGQVDGAVCNQANVRFLGGQPGLTGLRQVAYVGYDYPLGFAYRKDWPELGQILQRGLRMVTVDERAQVLARWMAAPDRAPWRNGQMVPLTAAGALLALCGGCALWNWRSRRHAA